MSRATTRATAVSQASAKPRNMRGTAREAYAAALVAFQGELPRIDKGQTATVPTKSGGKYSYDYADLADITEAAAPLLSKHGLAFSAKPTMTEHGFMLAYELLHSEGHGEGGQYPLPDPSQHSPQEIGSAISYGRRYSLCAITGIAPSNEDDDGAKAKDARAVAGLEARIRSAATHVGAQTAALSEQHRAKRLVWTQAKKMGWDKERLEADFSEWSQGQFLADADTETLGQYAAYLDEERKRGNREHKQLVADVRDQTQRGTKRKDIPSAERLDATPVDDPFYAEPAT